jgi:hypothetical protein
MYKAKDMNRFFKINTLVALLVFAGLGSFANSLISADELKGKTGQRRRTDHCLSKRKRF